MIDRWRDVVSAAIDAARAAPSAPWALTGGVTGLLRRAARRWPDRPGVRTLDETLTWAELDDRVDRAAAYWTARPLHGRPVALLMHNRLDGLVHQLGLARAGAVAAPIGPERRGPPLSHVLDAVRPWAVLYDADGAEALGGVPLPDAPGGLHRIAGVELPAVARPVADPVLAGERPYLLLATSGTTGRPKAARIPHRRALAAGFAFHGLGAHLVPEDVVFTPLPLSHASAQFAGLCAALWAGACFAFTARYSTRRYWHDAAALGATVGLYVGEIGRYLADAPPEADAPHRVHTLLGNGLAADVWPRLQARSGVERIVEFYGATEGPTLLINTTGKVGSCGRPALPDALAGLFLARYDVEDDTHPRDARGRCLPCREGEAGELLVRLGLSPMARFDGYRDKAATSAKVLTDVRRRGDRWFRTGDLLRRDADGDWFFVDRIGDTFRWKGHNVSTQAVAEAMGPAAGAPFAIYGVSLPHREGRAGMMAVAGPLDLDALAARAATLPAHARPLFLRRVDALEHTATGKVKKASLKSDGVAVDRLYVLDGETYAPVTDAMRAAIARGDWR